VGEKTGGDLVATLSSDSPLQGASISVASVTDGGTAVALNAANLSYQRSEERRVGRGAGAATSSYTPTEGDEGKTLSVVVTYADDPTARENATATAASAVGEKTGGDLVATLSSDSPLQGASISVASVTDGGTAVALNAANLSYQWKIDGANASEIGRASCREREWKG